MKINKYELNGNLVETVEAEKGKDGVNQAQAMSREENGYLCILGENLEAEIETERVILAVCLNGQVIAQSAYDS